MSTETLVRDALAKLLPTLKSTDLGTLEKQALDKLYVSLSEGNSIGHTLWDNGTTALGLLPMLRYCNCGITKDELQAIRKYCAEWPQPPSWVSVESLFDSCPPDAFTTMRAAFVRDCGIYFPAQTISLLKRQPEGLWTSFFGYLVATETITIHKDKL